MRQKIVREGERVGNTDLVNEFHSLDIKHKYFFKIHFMVGSISTPLGIGYYRIFNLEFSNQLVSMDFYAYLWVSPYYSRIGDTLQV